MLKKTISGDSFEAIAKRFGVTESSLIRHLEKHVSKNIPAVTVQKEVVPKDISQVISESLAELEWAKQRAKEKDDIRAFTDTVKTKLAFCMKFVETQNQQEMLKGDKIPVGQYNNLVEEWNKLNLHKAQTRHVINMIMTLPCGDFKQQYLHLMSYEQKTGRDVEFYSSYMNPFLDEVEKEGGSDEYFYKRLTEIIQELEKDNPVYNYYKEIPDILDLVKYGAICLIQVANWTLINKAKKNKLTEKEILKAKEVLRQLNDIDPGGKIIRKFKDTLEKMKVDNKQIKPK